MKSLWYWLCRGIESSCKGGIAYCVNYLAVWSKFFCTFPAPLSYALLLLFLERNLNFWIDSDGSHSRISKMERADMQKITDSPLLLGIFQVRALEVCLSEWNIMLPLYNYNLNSVDELFQNPTENVDQRKSCTEIKYHL